jgi:hypothetical protein
MSSLSGARRERRLLRRLDQDLPSVSGFGDGQGPPPHQAKDWLGAMVTVAIIGVFLLQVTYGLASRCGAALVSHGARSTCSGLPAMANHARGAVALAVAAFGGLAVIAFVWYMVWGYKSGARATGSRDLPGS